MKRHDAPAARSPALEVDLLLIGAGPSNIALAVALEELGGPPGVQQVVMLEAGDAIAWHPGMLFPQAQSQVSFLKDLATLRNPTSPYTFLNFLHKTGRLDDFVNLQTFFPYRREISAYLRWCVELLQTVEVHYGAAVEAIRPELDAEGRVQRWCVTTRHGHTYWARRIVYGAGRAAHVPQPFARLGHRHVLHASRFMQAVGRYAPQQLRSIAVVGGAQSSAEVYQECLQRYPEARVHLLMRSVGLMPYGGSKFTNELYNDGFIDQFHAAPADTRARMLAAMHDSNYAGVTPATLESLFRLHYLQRLEQGDRAQIHTRCHIEEALAEGEHVRLRWRSGEHEALRDERFDLVVLGTGYDNGTPPLLRQVLQQLGQDELRVGRNYRADIACTPGASLHVLGVNEATHGISDTLLSVVGARAQRVLGDMRNGSAATPAMPAATPSAAVALA